MDRMSPLDASFLHVEDAVSHMHIGSVAIFEGPPPATEDFERDGRGQAARRPALPPEGALRAAAARPAGVGRRPALQPRLPPAAHRARARPGGDRELRNLVGRVMSQQLDRHKPLWEMWIVEGLEHGHWALVSKVHHCMVDGVSGTDLLTVVLDAEPEPARADARRVARPSPSPATCGSCATRSSTSSRAPTSRSARCARRPARPARRSRQLGEVARGLRAWTGVVRPTPASSINGPIGPHRRWDWARTTLADVKTVRRGARRHRQRRRADRAHPRLSRPAALARRRRRRPRRAHARAGLGAHARRARHLQQPGVGDDRRAARRARRPGRAPRARSAPRWTTSRSRSRPWPARCSRRSPGSRRRCCSRSGTRVAMRIPQRNVNTVTTNVPGPQHQLYACGRPMIEAFPFVPLASTVRVGVAIFSYNGHAQLRRHRRLRHRARHLRAVQRCGGRDDRAAQARRDEAEPQQHRPGRARRPREPVAREPTANAWRVTSAAARRVHRVQPHHREIGGGGLERDHRRAGAADARDLAARARGATSRRAG